MYCKLEFPHSPDAQLCIASQVDLQVKNIKIITIITGMNYQTI